MPTQENQNSDPVVLLIDEDVLVRLSIAEYLRGCGIAVLEASGAEEGRVILKSSERVTAMLCDAQLSGEGGFAFAHWARRRRPGVPLLLLASTAAKTRAAAELCDEHGPREKLCDHQTLTTRIQALLAKRTRNGKPTRALRGVARVRRT